MKGIVAWFARNTVAANLIMIMVLGAGIMTLMDVPEEVFPEFSIDTISITVVYLGAAPQEVEEGVNIRIEEAVQGIDGIQRVTSTAAEGLGTVLVELQLGVDNREVLDEIKNAVDAIESFPAETEKPIIRELTNRQAVVDVAIYGDVEEKSLKRIAERVRDELAALPELTQVEFASERPWEISIEMSEADLRRHALTFTDVADAVRASSLDLPGGSIKTDSGEVLLRTTGQARTGGEFENIPLLTRSDGSQLRLGDVAVVKDGFAETDQSARFDGLPAFLIRVYRTGDQRALTVADAVHRYVEAAPESLPEGVSITTWQDQSKVLRDRLDLLMRNGRTGFVLVFIVLALFLRLRLAFWVSIGIPISFLGAIWLMPFFDVSINLMSLFAFILVLGLVVDDAIVVGENIYTRQEHHGDGERGSIEGVQEVSTPVVFAVLTTMAAFSPLLNVPGVIGKIIMTIPIIVICCLVFSLIESLLVLPAHLSHKTTKPKGERGFWFRLQRRISRGLHWFIVRVYEPVLAVGLRWRYLTVAIGVATLVITLGLVAAGMVRFVFLPDIEADFVIVSLTMPQGTPERETSEAVRRIEDSAERLRAEIVDTYGIDVFRHVYAAIGAQPMNVAQRQSFGDVSVSGSTAHLGEVTLELVPAEERGGVSSDWIAGRWREITGTIPDAVRTNFSASLFSAGEDINVQFTGPDLDQLTAAADELQARLRDYGGVYDISDSFLEGKRELQLDILPAAETLGLDLADLARQVRQAFYGEEAQRIQRGRDDLRVMVRYPERERRSLGDLEAMRVRTRDGAEVPFSEVAVVEPGRGYSTITRVDRQRAVNVTAAVDLAVATPGEINGALEAVVLPEIMSRYPRLSVSFEGEAAEQRDTLEGLTSGFGLALMAIFGLLAVPLRSYTQPVIIMAAIPFGIVGAVWGHVFMGLDLTILSMFGVVALAGVVVNDSLVLVDFINRRTADTHDLHAAVREGGKARFRPILLTSLTTFAGLTPMMLERSLQAQFLIPMAVSLAFGVLFATFVSLMLVPCGYLIVEDVARIPSRIREMASVARQSARGRSRAV